MDRASGLGLVLGLGMTVGFATAGWCLLTGGSFLLALLGYSLGGTLATLTGAICLALVGEPEEEDSPVIAD